MGRKARIRKEKRDQLLREKREEIRRIEEEKSPWLKFWKRWQFWTIFVCVILVVLYPFIGDYFKPESLQRKSRAIIHTSEGDITIKFYNDDAPKTVKNFQELARKGYYNNLTFHRVIKNFIVQTGDPTGSGSGGESIYGQTFDDEINAKSLGLDKIKVSDASYLVGGGDYADELKIYADYNLMDYYSRIKGYKYIDDVKSHKITKGTVAMANYGPNTNGSQFFIVTTEDQPQLDGKHTAFAEVISGLDIAIKISEVEVDDNAKPKTPITINSIELKR